MNAALNENQAELRVPVLAVAIHVLADRHCFLNQVIQIFWKGGRLPLGLQNPKDLAAGNEVHLWNTEAISQCHTDLGWCQTLLGQLGDMVAHILRLHLQPCWCAAAVWSRGR